MAELLFSLVIGTADYALVKFGGLLVRIGSFGQWRAEPLLSIQYRHRSRAGALSYADGDTRTVTHTGQLVLALLFCIILGIGVYASVN